MKHRKERSAGRPSRPAASRGRGKPKKNNNNNSDPQRKPVQAAGGAGGGPVGIPRRVRRTRPTVRPGPGPSAPREEERPPQRRARGPGLGPTGRPSSARGAAGTAAAAAAAPGSLRPAGGAFQAGEHSGPAREGASRSLQRETGRAERRSWSKKRKNRPALAPRAATGLPPGHAVPVPLGWAPRVRAAVPDARVTSRGRDRRLRSREPAVAAAPVVT